MNKKDLLDILPYVISPDIDTIEQDGGYFFSANYNQIVLRGCISEAYIDQHIIMRNSHLYKEGDCIILQTLVGECLGVNNQVHTLEERTEKAVAKYEKWLDEYVGKGK